MKSFIVREWIKRVSSLRVMSTLSRHRAFSLKSNDIVSVMKNVLIHEASKRGALPPSVQASQYGSGADQATNMLFAFFKRPCSMSRYNDALNKRRQVLEREPRPDKFSYMYTPDRRDSSFPDPTNQ